MSNSFSKVPFPKNEEVKGYKKNSPERILIEKELQRQLNNKIEIPIIIDGVEIFTGNTDEIKCPHDHSKVLAVYHKAGEKETELAISSALNAKKEWEALSWEDRAGIFLKAAELLAGPYRMLINASTMLGQSKTVHQAEIDSACELIDFWRFNAYYMMSIYSEQPYSPTGTWNKLEHRPLEGFIFAVTPFNFTSIAGNLPTSPALMGNVVVWKPASTGVLSSYYIMKLLQEAGLPKGVINFVPGKGASVGDVVMRHSELSGIHFTGSTGVFKGMWKTIGNNIENYKYYPRIVGETGGKDFVFAVNDCNPEELATALVRGAFEYQGQKCSAASRAYIPSSIWEKTKKHMFNELKKVKMGDVCDFSNFVGAVIDASSYKNIKKFIDLAKETKDAEIIYGGNCDDKKGYFIEPTIILCSDPKFITMEEELFGPVLSIYVYDDKKLEETLNLLDTTSPYALTGAIFAKNRNTISHLTKRLQNCAGNFYINDKPTGAVVGQQPFGGARASGTNDKAGSLLNLIRWVSPRTIKETFTPPTDISYPFMEN